MSIRTNPLYKATKNNLKNKTKAELLSILKYYGILQQYPELSNETKTYLIRTIEANIYN